ncbi:hypothetical protein D3C73_1642270 [compost metagenome]
MLLQQGAYLLLTMLLLQRFGGSEQAFIAPAGFCPANPRIMADPLQGIFFFVTTEICFGLIPHSLTASIANAASL